MNDNPEPINVDTIDQDLLRFYADQPDCYRVVLHFCHCRRSMSFNFHAYLPVLRGEEGVRKRNWWEWPQHPMDRQFYPEDCYNDDGTLDADKLVAQGWVLTENSAQAPPGYEGATLPGAARLITDLHGRTDAGGRVDQEGNVIPLPDDGSVDDANGGES